MKKETIEQDLPDRYSLKDTKMTKYLSTGSTLLNLVLGGGYGIGRMENIVGDKSTGKTLLAIEACAVMHKKFPESKIFYNETEAAFDQSYAAELGLPTDAVAFPETKHETVEDVFEHLVGLDPKKIGGWLSTVDPDQGGLYIIDSLDALMDRAEMEREIGKGSYGASKAKMMSQMFRKIIRPIEARNVVLIIVSQVRDNINAMFGEKHTRSGGRALDFYATHVLWLSQLGKIKMTRKTVERVIGVDIRVNCKKNKISKPHRSCDLPLIFDYGMNDIAAMLNWLAVVKRGKDAGIESTKKAAAVRASEIMAMDDDAHKKAVLKLRKTTRRVWKEIEDLFLPCRKKY